MTFSGRWVVPALAMLVVACANNEPEDDAGDTAPPASEPAPATPPADAPITAEVKGEGAGAGITGQATVTPTANGFDFAVNLNGVPAGAHAWHIHQGACGVPDTPVIVPFSPDGEKPGLTGDLEVDANGTISQTVAVPSSMLSLELIRTGDYALHVHERGGKDHGATIACADIK